jgi:hypothetical protein
MKKICFLLILTLSLSGVAQNITEVEATGSGLTKADALQDALRNAVSQGAGVALKSETKVENFMVVSDAIATNTQGYISKYTVVREVPFPGRFETTVKALVSLDPIKADFQLLSKTIGGVRFLAAVDESKAKADKATYDFAVEKINAHLASKNYRYIEKNVFERLRKEAMNMAEESDTGITNVQRMGIMADAQFLIVVSDITSSQKEGQFGTRTLNKVNVICKTYDNCTGEGLGTVILESGWKTSADNRSAVSEAIDSGMVKLLNTFTGYIGNWVNNGTPYEIRLYQMGTFRDLRELRTKLKNDPNFGGEMELTSVNNYTKLNCTFKKKPDDLADKVLEYCDEIATLAPQKIDVKLIFGRQISFAPQSYVIPNAVKPDANALGSSNGNTNAKPDAPVKQTPVNATPKSTSGTSSKPKSKTPTKGTGKSKPATNK